MIQPHELRYTLIIDGTDYVLPHAPSGWEESLKQWQRSDRYFGMMRSFTMPMKFVLDGAWLLRKEFYTNGLNSQTTIRIEELNRGNWVYRTTFLGDMDFSTFTDRRNEVEIAVMETGITEMVKAYEDVEYEIPLQVPGAFQVRIPGIGLVEKAASIIPTDDYAISFEFYNLLEIDIVVNELDSMYLTAQSVDKTGNFGSNLFPTSELWHIRGEEDTQVTFNGTLKGRYQLSRDDMEGKIYIISSNGGPSGTILYDIATLVGKSNPNKSLPFDISFTFNYQITAGEKLFIATRRLGAQSGTYIDILYIDEADIRVSNSLITPDTLAWAMRPFDLFRELLYRMNDYRPVEAQSFLLQSDNWKRLVITCGDAIRGLESPKIITSFSQFFQSMNAVLDVGFGQEAGRAVLEKKPYWMKGNLKAVDVGEVKEFSLEVAEEFMYNSVKVGYKDQEYEVDYGRDEVNSEQQYSLPVTRIQKSLDLISYYRADQFGIEELRTLPVEANTDKKDKESDNDTWMIKIQAEPDEDGIYDVEGAEAYREGDGVQKFGDRLAYYNLDITPKKNLLRHGEYFRSILHRFEQRNIRFESAKKNAEALTIDLTGKRIRERDNVPVSILGPAFFLPYLANIRVNVPKTAGQTLDTIPTGYIEFSVMGDKFRGFILEVTEDVPRNSDQEWKLLLTADSVIEKLIR